MASWLRPIIGNVSTPNCVVVVAISAGTSLAIALPKYSASLLVGTPWAAARIPAKVSPSPYRSNTTSAAAISPALIAASPGDKLALLLAEYSCPNTRLPMYINAGADPPSTPSTIPGAC